MIRRFSILFLVVLLSVPFVFLNAQLKSQIREKPSVRESISIPGIHSSSLGFNLLDPRRFTMHHSYSLSFANMGNYSTSMGVYQNLMSYVFSKKLWVNANIGFIHNPMKVGMNDYSTSLMDNLIYGAELDYHPKDNIHLNIRFNSVPMRYRYSLSPFSNRYAY